MQPIPLVPHVTVSGYRNGTQASLAVEQLDKRHLMPHTNHLLGVGVHIQRNIRSGSPGAVSLVGPTDVCLERADVYNTVHFIDPDGSATDATLRSALDLAGEHVNAIQLHHPWQSIATVCHALERNRFGNDRRCPVKIAWRMDLETLGGRLHRDPRWLIAVLQQRNSFNTIDWITFDVGDGSRVEEYRETLRDCYRAIRNTFAIDRLRVAVAADLTPNAAKLLVSLFANEEAASTISYMAVARNTLTDGALPEAMRFYEDVFHLLGWRSV